MGRPEVWMEVNVAGQPVGRLTFELFQAEVPKTCANFKALCTGELTSSDPALSYAGCPFHRIIPGFMAQGGDTTRGDGTGGKSIYGPTFPDEGFPFPHDARGLLSMANAGPDTNGSQFFILFKPAAWLDRRHTVFGQLISGHDTLALLERVSTDASDRPLKPVEIAACGHVPGTGADEDPAAAADASANVDDSAATPQAGQAARAAARQLPRAFGKQRGHRAAAVSAEDSMAEVLRARAAQQHAAGAGEVDSDDEHADDDADAAEPASAGVPALDNVQLPKGVAARLAALKHRMSKAAHENRAAVREELKAKEDRGYAAGVVRAAGDALAAQFLPAAGAAAPASDADADLQVTAAQSQRAAEAAQAKRAAAANAYGWNAEGDAHQMALHEKRVAAVAAKREQLRHVAPTAVQSASVTTSATAAGAAGELNDYADAAGVAAMASALEGAGSKRKRSSAAGSGRAVDYVNARNKQFNDRVSSAYDKYSAEIRQNLEQGTAL